MVAAIDANRTLYGRAVAATFTLLAAIPLLSGTWYPPAWFAMAVATGLRNDLIPWLGSGLLFEGVAFGFLYLEAALFVALARAARKTATSLGGFVGHRNHQ